MRFVILCTPTLLTCYLKQKYIDRGFWSCWFTHSEVQMKSWLFRLVKFISSDYDNLKNACLKGYQGCKNFASPDLAPIFKNKKRKKNYWSVHSSYCFYISFACFFPGWCCVFRWLTLAQLKGILIMILGVQPPKMLNTFCLTDPIVFSGFQHSQFWNTNTNTHKL